MIEKLIFNKIFTIILLSLIAIISFGLDISAHQIYNLSQLIILENELNLEKGFNSYDLSHFNPLFYYFRYIVPLLEYGIIFVALSFAVKFYAFLLVYKISSNYLEDNLALLLSIIFLMAYLRASHGLIENGLWVAPIFFPAALSALATLSGIQYFIKEKFLISGVAFAVSIFFHSLYGITSLAFIFIGFIFILIFKNKNYLFRNCLVLIFPIIFAILYIAYFRIFDTPHTELNYSIHEWYQYTGGLVDFNMSILLTIFKTGYCIITIIIAGFYLAISASKKTTLELLTIFSTLMLFVITCIELIHRNGIYFNFFSEFFIATQFRRGIWIPVFFSLIQIAKTFFDNREEIFISKPKFFFLIFATSSYIFPSIFGILIVFSALFAYLRNTVGFILFLFSLFLSVIHYTTGYLELAFQIKTFVYSIVFMSIVTALFSLLKYRWSSYSTRFCSAIICSIIIIFTARGLFMNKLNNDLSLIFSDGLFSKTQISDMNNFLGSVNYDVEIDLCMQKKSMHSSDQKIQLPITGIRNSRLSLFPFEQVHGYFNPMYSRKDFEYSINGLEKIYGSDFMNSFFEENDTFNDDYFSESYSSIPINQLLYLRDKYNLRFYISNSERLDLSDLLICKSNKYLVYDLKLLNKI